MLNSGVCKKCDFLRYLLIFVFLVLFCIFIPKLSFSYEVNVAEIVTAIASAFIPFLAYRIQRIQSETQKSQAITQLNQAFNDINKLVMSDPKNKVISEFARRLYELPKKDNNSNNVQPPSLCQYCSKEFNKNEIEQQLIPLVLIIMNTYEAYYISNKKAFDPDPPLILKNLFTYYEPLACGILTNHSYDEGFIKVFIKK